MALSLLRACLPVILIFPVLQIQAQTTNEEDPDFWYDKAQRELDNAVDEAKGFNLNRADGMILFIGDGMSVTTVTGVRIWKGQKEGKRGEETDLVYDKFPHFGYSKTYNTNSQVPDSAGTATAYLTGVKTKRRVLGLDGGIEVKDCASTKGHDVDSILVKAKQAGLPVGIVTTTRITHASPAGSYSHVPERDWEDDSKLPADAVASGCRDIAWQLVHGTEIDVIMGGGRQRLRMQTQTDEEEPNVHGLRLKDDLIQDWKDRYGQIGNAEYVISKSQLAAIDPDETEFLLGLFDVSEMQFDIANGNDKFGNPTLAEMTEKAIQILQKKSPDGRFFLFVEGGRIDHGHHFTQAKYAITDGLALENAITKAVEITTENTLIVISSDHGHTMSFAGYAPRGNSIFGKIDSDKFGMPYTPLGYYTGREAYTIVAPTFALTKNRPDITTVDTESQDYHQQSFVPSIYETHGGEDVGIFARGPWSHLFHSVHEQNYIPHVMMFAGCIGDFLTNCRNSPLISGSPSGQDAALPARFQLKSQAVPTTPEPDTSGAADLGFPGTTMFMISMLLKIIVCNFA